MPRRLKFHSRRASSRRPRLTSSRARRWREGPTLETAIWAENIPFNETRDYVKKVLSNAAVYAALLDPRQVPALRPRLGPGIGPRDGATPPPNTELP